MTDRPTSRRLSDRLIETAVHGRSTPAAHKRRVERQARAEAQQRHAQKQQLQEQLAAEGCYLPSPDRHRSDEADQLLSGKSDIPVGYGKILHPSQLWEW